MTSLTPDPARRAGGPTSGTNSATYLAPTPRPLPARRGLLRPRPGREQRRPAGLVHHRAGLQLRAGVRRDRGHRDPSCANDSPQINRLRSVFAARHGGANSGRKCSAMIWHHESSGPGSLTTTQPRTTPPSRSGITTTTTCCWPATPTPCPPRRDDLGWPPVLDRRRPATDHRRGGRSEPDCQPGRPAPGRDPLAAEHPIRGEQVDLNHVDSARLGGRRDLEVRDAAGRQGPAQPDRS